MVRTVLLPLLLSVAYGYNWGVGPPGPNFNYRVETGSFTSAEEDAIDAGAATWNAGAGQVLRGADVHVTRDADRCSTCTGRGNGFDEVYMRDEQWFLDHYGSGYDAICDQSLIDVDIIFNGGTNWCTELPASCGSGSDSIGQVMIHEFGHKIGFQHENDVIATMNEYYPSGGDISDEYRLHEDDSVGLQAHKGDSSTGVNLMLSKFIYGGGGYSTEGWVRQYTWDLSDGDWVWPSAGGLGPPANILAIIEGTSSETPLVEWRVTASGLCFDGAGTEHTVGSRTPGLTPNVAYSIGPNSWSFVGVPVGSYTLCAKIDADDAITETSSVDNQIRSDPYPYGVVVRQ